MIKKHQKNDVFFIFNIKFNMFGINNSEISRLHREDFIWFIYFFIISFNLYSNYLEEEYIKNKDDNLRKKFRKINVGVFSVVLIIYIYFLIVSYDRIKELKPDSKEKQKQITYLSFISSILFIIAGIISLYIAIESNNIDDEIGLV